MSCSKELGRNWSVRSHPIANAKWCFRGAQHTPQALPTPVAALSCLLHEAAQIQAVPLLSELTLSVLTPLPCSLSAQCSLGSCPWISFSSV